VKKIKVLHVPVGGPARVVEIDRGSLVERQNLVDGLIEAAALPTGHNIFWNEEYLFNGSEFNQEVVCGRGDERAAAEGPTLMEAMFGVTQATTYPVRVHGAYYVTGATDRNGYDTTLKDKDLPVLAKHLGIEIEGVA
jgi:hypothetical protein